MTMSGKKGIGNEMAHGFGQKVFGVGVHMKAACMCRVIGNNPIIIIAGIMSSRIGNKK